MGSLFHISKAPTPRLLVYCYQIGQQRSYLCSPLCHLSNRHFSKNISTLTYVFCLKLSLGPKSKGRRLFDILEWHFSNCCISPGATVFPVPDGCPVLLGRKGTQGGISLPPPRSPDAPPVHSFEGMPGVPTKFGGISKLSHLNLRCCW